MKRLDSIGQYKLKFTSLGLETKEQAFDYYFERSYSASNGFIAILQATEKLIERSPRTGLKYKGHDNLRSHLLPRFPFRVYYRIDDDKHEIHELLVFNIYQNPSKLEKLLKQL